MSPIVATNFYFRLLKRDYIRMVDAVGYINEHDCPFVPRRDPDRDPLAASTVVEWTDTQIDFPSFEHELEQLSILRLPPTTENRTPNLAFEDSALRDPWLWYNDIDFVPFMGRYESQGAIRCFASYRNELAICNANASNQLEPAEDEDPRVGSRFLEFRQKVEECLAFFDESCRMTALLPYTPEPITEYDPEPPIASPLGQLPGGWVRPTIEELEYDFTDEQITQVHSNVLAGDAFDAWQSWKHQKTKPSGKRRRRRRRR